MLTGVVADHALCACDGQWPRCPAADGDNGACCAVRLAAVLAAESAALFEAGRKRVCWTPRC